MEHSHNPIEAWRGAERRLWGEYGLSMRERFIEAGNPPTRIRVLECGDPQGTPVVFVAGGLGEAAAWVDLLPRLTSFRCITLDRPGSGMSDPLDQGKNVHPSEQAREVLQAVLEDAGLSSASFVANSMGGWWTIQLARAHPDRVSRMVLIGCPALLLSTSAPLPMRLMSIPGLGRLLARLMVSRTPEDTRKLPETLGHPPNVWEGWPEIRKEVLHLSSQLPHFVQSWHHLLRQFLRPWGANRHLSISPEDLRQLTQPILLIWGESDPFGGLDVARETLKHLPHARMEVVGSGHLPWWDDPAECAHQIETFLQ